ncbi:hypothetical protein FRC00_002144 [Tulasnella sp. 408]|nr:hypothetical protein FRC00_002144 [Tulasnella sp. 408]
MPEDQAQTLPLEHIDFFRLAPEERSNKGSTVVLQLLDNGTSTRALRGGRREQREARLQDKGIGDAHCFLELHLLYDHGKYRQIDRFVAMNRMQLRSFRHALVHLRPGPKKKYRYRYVSPKKQRSCDASVFLVKKRYFSSFYATKVVKPARLEPKAVVESHGYARAGRAVNPELTSGSGAPRV